MMTPAQLYAHLTKIRDAYTAAMQPMSASLDMPPVATVILMFLANNPECDTAKDVCACLSMKPALVSFHVENLVQAGYLERGKAAGDRRKHCLRCTDKAAPAVEQGRALQKAFLTRLTQGLSEDELKTCLHCLSVFGENIS